MISLSDLIVMKNEGNNNIKWLGFNLTKKKAYYLLVLSIFGFFLFTLLMFNALEVLLEARTIYQYDISIYFKILLLGFSNLIISLIFIGICGYTLKQILLFRKSLKIQ